MNQTNWTYLAQLARALQMEGVEGHRSGEFIAEIDSHLAETGVDPVEEFGTPYELAAELAVRPGARRPGWVPPLWLMWLLSAVASMIAVVAVDAVMLGWEDGQVPIRARGIVWIAVFMASSLSFGYFATRRLDGRSWRPLNGGGAALIIFGIAVVVTTASQMVGDRVIATVPAVAFWVTAAIALPLLIVVIARRNNPIRFPAHAAHLRRLRRGIFAGRPPSGD